MNIHKYALKALASLLALLMLTGCELPTFVPEDLMRPPKVSGDGADIQRAMTELLGSQITLRYPRRGEYRSAVVRADIDGDENQEAIVFYRKATESSGAHMALLDTDEHEKWCIIGEAESNGGDIDRVLFGDLTGNGNMEIITGWSVYPGSCIITAHCYAGGAFSRLNVVDTAEETGTRSAALYSEMAVGDFDRDGSDDILTAYINTADSSVTARLLCFQSGAGGIAEIGTAASVELSGDAAEYIGSQAGMLSTNVFGLALDSRRRDGLYMTEFVYWDKNSGRLVAPISGGDALLSAAPRTLATRSRDINSDGMIEFPSDAPLTGYNTDSQAPLYVTKWHRLVSQNAVRDIFDTLIFEDNGYYLILRSAWKNKLSAQPDKLSNVTYFCTAEGGNPFAAEVMRIKIFTLDEWDDEDHEPIFLLGSEDEAPHYMELASTDYYVYAVLISPCDESLDISYESVLDSFRLIERSEALS